MPAKIFGRWGVLIGWIEWVDWVSVCFVCWVFCGFAPWGVLSCSFFCLGWLLGFCLG